MTNRDRFLAVLNGEEPDRLPCVEWAGWWEKTTSRWAAEEPACPRDQYALYRYLGLDTHCQYWLSPRGGKCPGAAFHGAPVIENEQDFKRILPHLFPEEGLRGLKRWLLDHKERHDRGEIAIWYTLEGFFWFPRTLFGIENHLYAFYDFPELMHEMNRRLADYNRKAVEVIHGVLTPEFMTLAEDMSYNHGPMLSKGCFDEFLAPYYRELTPLVKRLGTKVLVDTDGGVEPMLPWFQEVGVEGVLPLERQAGVDVSRIRQRFPGWIMVGGFDKTVMRLGEAAMRREFERLLPAMRSGRYIPAVDHQTPPDVSLENYKIYVRLLKEYAAKGAKQGFRRLPLTS
jgi:hypothetical protein